MGIMGCSSSHFKTDGELAYHSDREKSGKAEFLKMKRRFKGSFRAAWGGIILPAPKSASNSDNSSGNHITDHVTERRRECDEMCDCAAPGCSERDRSRTCPPEMYRGKSNSTTMHKLNSECLAPPRSST